MLGHIVRLVNNLLISVDYKSGISDQHGYITAKQQKTFNFMFQIGESLTIEELASDPYPIYTRLRETEPVSWVPAINMFVLTRYKDIQNVLLDGENFHVGGEGSTLTDTFGEHMLTVD